MSRLLLLDPASPRAIPAPTPAPSAATVSNTADGRRARNAGGAGTSFIPRSERDLHRGRLAAARVRAAGGTAMDAALENIAAAFSTAAVPNKLKLHVERHLRAELDDAGTYARFAYYADRGLLRLSLDSAIKVAECDYTLHRALSDRRRGYGPRLPLMVASELRLALRFLRRFSPETWNMLRHAAEQAREYRMFGKAVAQWSLP